jgi:nicotinamidase-related amidase
MLLVDFQAGLGFGVESMPRQVLIHNAVALARTAVAFKVPVVASTSATRVYSGPLLPALQEALPSVKAIERRSMNVWAHLGDAWCDSPRRQCLHGQSPQTWQYTSALR